VRRYLTKSDTARNMARFYALDIQRNLFGEWELVREWGRIGQPGQVRRSLYAEEEGAIAAFERELWRRTRRGYSVL